MIPLLPLLSIKNLSIALGFIVITGALYVKGRYDGADKVELQYAQEKLVWEQKISEEQNKLDDKVQEAVKEYIKSSGSAKEIIKYVKSKPTIITKYIPDDSCEIPNSFVELHNKAVDNKSLGDLQDNTASGMSSKKLSDVAATITVNYYQYNEMKTKLETLQQIVKNYKNQQSNLIGIGSE